MLKLNIFKSLKGKKTVRSSQECQFGGEKNLHLQEGNFLGGRKLEDFLYFTHSTVSSRC